MNESLVSDYVSCGNANVRDGNGLNNDNVPNDNNDDDNIGDNMISPDNVLDGDDMTTFNANSNRLEKYLGIY